MCDRSIIISQVEMALFVSYPSKMTFKAVVSQRRSCMESEWIQAYFVVNLLSFILTLKQSISSTATVESDSGQSLKIKDPTEKV